MGAKYPTSAIVTAKVVLRKKMKEVLNNMTPEDREKQSRVIFEKLIATPEWAKASRISCYLSMPEEVQTDRIIEEALNHGKSCFVPITKGNDMHMLKLKNSEDLEKLPRNNWGIRLPKPVEGRENAMKTGGVDIVVVPGVAFTDDGKRLGHGRGYYDRFIKELRKIHNNPKTFAVAFNQQVVDDVPVNEEDENVDVVMFSKCIFNNKTVD